jgi:hypothetical protein
MKMMICKWVSPLTHETWNIINGILHKE